MSAQRQAEFPDASIETVDPLTDVVTLLQPSAGFAKSVCAGGTWRVHREDAGEPFYCMVLEGGCHLAIDGQTPLTLQAGDFVLLPAAYGFGASSLQPPDADSLALPAQLGPGHFRLGDPAAPIDVRMLIGHCHFGSPDTQLLVSQLPRQLHIRGEPRLTTLTELLGEESRAQRPGRDVVLARLLEVLLIEALRSAPGTGASPGLVRGLADPRLADAIRAMHAAPAHAWTVAELARTAALSRSAFFERFHRCVGVAPMAYLLAWRMALARHMLRHGEAGLTRIAEHVGYRSASAFSVAFSRHVGVPPTRYARQQAARPAPA